jgi:hypothetical protein
MSSGGGNPYLQIALFAAGQVMKARAAKGQYYYAKASADLQRQQLEQQRIEIEEQSKQDELELRQEEEESKSKRRAAYGAMGVMYSDFGSRRAMEYHQDKLFDIDMGEILASKRNRLIENQYSIHGTELEKKAARERYKGQIGEILFESGTFAASMSKPPIETETGGIERYPGEYEGGETQSGRGGEGGEGRGTKPTGRGGEEGSVGTQSGRVPKGHER